MKRIVIILAMIFLFTTTAFAADPSLPKVGTLPSTTPELKVIVGTCCISGHYLGNKLDTICTPGKTPDKGNFTMDIMHAAKCGGTFTAKVTDSKDGHITDFTGTVVPSTVRGCCQISAKTLPGTENVSFKGTICKKLVKWEAKGAFEAVDCKGTWNMRQL